MPPVGPRPLVTVTPMMYGCRGSAMYLVSLHYLARANSIACIATKPTKAFDLESEDARGARRLEAARTLVGSEESRPITIQ